MGRLLSKVLTATVIIMIVYIGAQYWLGTQLEQQVDIVATDLSTQDGVEVRGLYYDRRLANGTLYYDVTLDTSSALVAEYLPMLQTLLPGEQLQLEGSVAVNHGPWFADQGFGIAEGTWLFEPDGEWRTLLPDAAPAARLRVRLLLGFADRLRLSIDASDYDGRMVLPESDQVAQLKLSGLHGHIASNRTLSELSSQGNLDAFSFAMVDDGELVTVSVTGLEGSGAWQQEAGLWTGDYETRSRQASISSPGALYRVNGVHQLTSMHSDAGVIQIDQQVSVDSVQTDAFRLNGVQLSLTLGGIDSTAYMALGGQPGVAPLDEQAYMDAIAALLRAEPWLAINRLSVNMDNDDDILLTGRAQIAGARTLDEAAAATSLNGELTVRNNVVRAVVRSLMVSDTNPGLSARERQQQEEDAYELFMESLALFPQLEITDQYIRGSASVENGTLLIGGQPVFDLGGLFLPQQSAFGGWDQNAWGQGDVSLDTSAAPLYGRVALQTGFAPDPHLVDITAGGLDWLDGSLIGGGDFCVGFVNAERPDLSVAYQGNSGPLYLSVNSADDTTLVIRTPDGSWACNDDGPGLGLDPAVSFGQAPNGEYLIWVGTYDETLADARIRISTTPPGTL